MQHALAKQLAPAVRIHHSQANLGGTPSKAHVLRVLAQLEPLRVGLDALEEPICMWQVQVSLLAWPADHLLCTLSIRET